MQKDTAPILVTGGTGTLGRLVVARLRDAGHSVRVVSRSLWENGPGIEYVVGDLGTGEGVDAAVRGVATVVHCAGSNKGDEDKARILVRAASAAGVSHLVYISVVGADRIMISSRLDRLMFGYFGSKRAAEEVIAGSGIPFTTLRATQFHDLVLLALQQLAKLPLVPAPKHFRLQPVDAGDVAARLTGLALAPPAGLVPDLGGPRIYQFSELMREYLRTTSRRRLIVPVPMPGNAAATFRSGGNLTPDHADGQQTWERFLCVRLGVQLDQAAASDR
jgi:uncharacterized protein YbjT (DUF2867 family)